VTKTSMPIAEAKKSGAVAMFGEKYGDVVRIVAAGDFSREFCGGCHVNRTGDIGVFKIISDRSLAAGVRRMEALTGRGAVQYFQTLDDSAHELQQQLNTKLEEVPAYVRSLQDKQKALEKELKQLKMKLAGGGSSRDEMAPADVNGVKLLAKRFDEISGGDLRNLADELRSKIKSGVVVIGSATDGKVTLLTAVTKDLVDRVTATGLMQKLAPIVGGKGGGKPDLAQAGGKDPGKLDEALGQAEGALRELLST
jgi:alanyl-tRNA synthetase